MEAIGTKSKRTTVGGGMVARIGRTPGSTKTKEADPEQRRAAEEKRRRYRGRQLHQACMELLKTHTAKCQQLFWMIRIPNGEYGSNGSAALIKSISMKSGIPNLICPKRSGVWRGMAISIKLPGQRLRKGQIEWMNTLAEEGWLTAKVSSIKEMESVLEIYNKGEKELI
jgi:hypothetical protein